MYFISKIYFINLSGIKSIHMYKYFVRLGAHMFKLPVDFLITRYSMITKGLITEIDMTYHLINDAAVKNCQI